MMAELRHQKFRPMVVFLIVVVVLNVLTLVALTVVWRTQGAREFQPFRFPVQTVLNRLPGKGNVPAAYVGDPIVVRGTKCNTSDKTFDITAVVTWASVDPPGNIIGITSPGGPVAPGCVTKTFVNQVPEISVDQMRKLLSSRPYVVWQLRGSQTAAVENGATRVWRTESFYIYPKPKEE